ncbi:histidinol dehydrogenase [Gramella lutea]|uniref:Histidinol dehydrogenase n=1 Tax=Christiangramia lutea TaxID=1607951 RepID=A0A9X1V3K8_9FLAO|nr:histidinol dehydrogenase [Christiangramia lutea]MCH4823235.1 histidinol dehydrogenase [Christiangramia lutea]
MNKYINPSKKDWFEILRRPTQTVAEIEQTVNQIFDEIRVKGDAAVAKYTELFDGIRFEDLRVSSNEIKDAEEQVSQKLESAIDLAKGNIEKFHLAQRSEKVSVETTQGVKCWQEKKAIQRVGLYIPGGTAPLFSSILMLAIPAKLAGCEEIILCTPPDKEGRVNPAILYVANLCGVTEIFKIGGIQAIGAMTFGTETVPQVYKIFGPGNQYVTVAKQLATKYQVAIDMPAGPSELLVFADDSANPAYVASDLLSQAEHGKDSQVILVTTSENLVESVSKELYEQLNDLPRKAIAEGAIENSRLIKVSSNEEALVMINEYGPEHFIICSSNEDYFIEGVRNAGSVFIGDYTPESAGDYASGTNHTLPTNGYAKQYSGVNLDSFMKTITFQKISEAGIKAIGPSIELLAEAEGLQAHKNAVSLRLKDIV